MLRRLARLVAAVGIVWVMPLHALGLGEVDVRSKLNQKFSASIPVIDSSQQELDSLQVVMANPADFDRAGIERVDYLASITLKLETGPGGARVLVSSTKIEHEPFLNFLVEAHWQGGRLLREYTVLLDPPNLLSNQTNTATAPAAAPSAEVSTAPVIETAPEPAPVAEAPMPEVAPPAPTPTAPIASAPLEPAAESQIAASTQKSVSKDAETDKAASGTAVAKPFSSKTVTETSTDAKTYGPVDPTETLWGIAGRVRPEAASTDQTLLALGLANPEAFDRGLFNGLMKGVTLKVPSDTAIESVPPDVARDRIAQWRKGGKLSAESTKTASSTIGSPVVKPSSAAVAKVPEPSPFAAMPAMPPTMPGPSAKPATVNPDSTAAVVKGSSQSAASSPLAASGSSAPMPSASPAPATAMTSAPVPAAASATTSGGSPTPSPSLTAPSTATTSLAPTPAATAVSASPAISEQPTAAAPGPAPVGITAESTSGSAAPAVAAAAPVKAAGSSDSAAGFWVLLLLAALIGFLVWRSNKRAKLLKGSAAQPPMTMTSAASSTPKPALPAPQSSSAKDSNAESSLSQDVSAVAVKPLVDTSPFGDADPVFEPITGAAPAKASEQVIAPAPGLAKIDSQLGVSDPISEADFHLAYGLHDEAANLLRRGIESEPSRKDLRVKLAEVYFAAQKAAEFQQTAVPLRGQIPAADWQKLAALGRQISPDVAAFRDDADATETPRAPSVASTPAPSNLLDFNFDAPAKSASSSSEPSAKSNNLLDFDFDAELANLQPKSLNKSMPLLATPDESPHEFDLSQEMEDSKPAAMPADPPGSEVDLSQSFPESPLSTDDEVGTKLDLARAYADMGDNEAATELLREVALAGNSAQMQEAEALAKRLRSA